MPQVYHFIRKGGEAFKGLCCNSLQFFRPDQLVAESPVEWGVQSDGSRILGYSILKDALGEEVAHHNFKRLVQQVLLPLSLDEWRITKEQLEEFCDYHLQMAGITFTSVTERMNPANWNKPTAYCEMPLMPVLIGNPNLSLVVPERESLTKN
jgi:hypothetical protein